MQSGMTVGGIFQIERMNSVLIEWRIPNFSILKDVCLSPEFSFLGKTCSFRSYLSEDYIKGSISVTVKGFEKFAECYTLKVKKPDGTLEEIETCCFQKDEFVSPGFMTRGSELCPLGIMTIVCEVNLWMPAVEQAQRVQQSSKLVELDTLSSDFGSLFENKIKSDVTLRVGTKKFEAHRIVLMARSKVLDASFLHNTSEQETDVVIIPDCDSDSFEIFLRYLYTGRMEEISARDATHLHVIAEKYDMPKLKSFCVGNIAQNLSLENICSVAATAHLYENTDLMSSVQTFFNRNLPEILRTDEWEKMLKDDYRLANQLLKQMTNTY